jgi:hypothetical protein
MGQEPKTVPVSKAVVISKDAKPAQAESRLVSGGSVNALVLADPPAEPPPEAAKTSAAAAPQAASALPDSFLGIEFGTLLSDVENWISGRKREVGGIEKRSFWERRWRLFFHPTTREGSSWVRMRRITGRQPEVVAQLLGVGGEVPG